MIELDKKNFDEEVTNAQGLVLVDYWSQSCEPCKALMPFVHGYEEEYSDKIKFCSLDIASGRRVAIGQKVLGLPALIVYKDGVEVKRVAGDEATKESVLAMIKEFI